MNDPTPDATASRLIPPLGTARTLADSNRYDALVQLVDAADRAAGATERRGMAIAAELRESAARVRIAFGIRKS